MTTTPKVSPADHHRAVVIQRHGVLIPNLCVLACEEAGLSLALGASILLQETGGGRNEWGHDPTIFVGGFDAKHHHPYGPTVTEEGYRAYLEQRGPRGAGGMQGVGVLQATYYSIQDRVDALGGCWIVEHQLRVGFGDLAAAVGREGTRAAVTAYNGSGAAAVAYANKVLARMQAIQKALGGPLIPV